LSLASWKAGRKYNEGVSEFKLVWFSNNSSTESSPSDYISNMFLNKKNLPRPPLNIYKDT